MSGWDDRGDDGRDIGNQRAAGVMLDPLAKVEVGVLMAVLISGGEFVMDSQCSRQRGYSQEDQREGNRQRRADTPANTNGRKTSGHQWRPF